MEDDASAADAATQKDDVAEDDVADTLDENAAAFSNDREHAPKDQDQEKVCARAGYRGVPGSSVFNVSLVRIGVDVRDSRRREKASVSGGEKKVFLLLLSRGPVERFRSRRFDRRLFE
jgi:hypothetical protein